MNLTLCFGLRAMEKVITGRMSFWNRAVDSGALREWLIGKRKFHFHIQCYDILDNLKNSMNSK